MSEYDIDPEILMVFMEESTESLAELDSKLVELKHNPEDLEIVDEIFRPVHSIKGSSAFFGLLKVKELSHKIEDLLDKIRQEKMLASKEAIDSLLPAIDYLKTIFERVSNGEAEIDDNEVYTSILNKVILVSEDEGKILKRYDSDELNIIIGQIKNSLPEEKINLIEKLVNLLDFEYEISGESQIEGTKPAYLPEPILNIRQILCETIEDELDTELNDILLKELYELRTLVASKEAESIIEETLDEYNAWMVNIGFDAVLQKLVLEKMDRLEKIDDWKKEQTTKEVEAKSEKPEEVATKKSEKRKSGPEKSMRVAEKSIDSFLAYVGELVVVEEMFNYLQKRLSASSTDRFISAEFKRVIETFSSLSDGLRRSILEIRTVPLKTILQKAPRIVYDIASRSGKEVDVNISGEETKVDKSYIDILDAPFTHIIRNAIDHGIETTDKRIEAGKQEKGRINIDVVESKRTIDITISDNGAGINFDAIREKAEKTGIIETGEKLTEEAIVGLLFMSGVSTAEEVTDVSGRGVGMDVVKQNIDSAGGKLSVESSAGEGSTFKISLPKSVSTQIMDGFLFKTADEVYVMPMEFVGESFALMDDDISSVSNKGEVVMRRGDLLPLIRLANVLNGVGSENQEAVGNNSESIVISINIRGSQYALCVDEIVGVQKVVVKSVEGFSAAQTIFEGAAMMGDGTVAMILGAEGLTSVSKQ